MSHYYLLDTNPCEYGYCDIFSVCRAEYDVDDWRLISKELLLSDQLLTQPLGDYELYIDYEEFPECAGKPLVDYIQLSNNRIISSRLKDIFEQHKVPAEYFPVKFQNIDATEYYLAHFLTMVACYDEERSTDTNRPYQRGYNVKAIYEHKIPEGVLLFRERENLQSDIFVHETLKQAIEAAEIKGVLILPLPVDGWEKGELIRKLEEDCEQREMDKTE